MEKLLTATEVAERLGISAQHVQELVRSGKLTGYQLGGQYLRFRPVQVRELQGVVRAQPGPKNSETQQDSWLHRVREFLYFHDGYILAAILLVGVWVYLMATG